MTNSIIMFFFFSSRRRHTRCLSDWSSDVCSSDLVETIGLPNAPGTIDQVPIFVTDETSRTSQKRASVKLFAKAGEVRSEERRVGKECRSRRSAKHKRNKARGEQKESITKFRMKID